jgi:hypothetical protein
MSPRKATGIYEERCGCRQEAEHYLVLCQFHWNEGNLRSELDEARRWDHSGKSLDPDEWSDRRVLNFYDQLCYWAAKGIGDAGYVGSIYSASRESATDESA